MRKWGMLAMAVTVAACADVTTADRAVSGSWVLENATVVGAGGNGYQLTDAAITLQANPDGTLTGTMAGTAELRVVTNGVAATVSTAVPGGAITNGRFTADSVIFDLPVSASLASGWHMRGPAFGFVIEGAVTTPTEPVLSGTFQMIKQ